MPAVGSSDRFRRRGAGRQACRVESLLDICWTRLETSPRQATLRPVARATLKLGIYGRFRTDP